MADVLLINAPARRPQKEPIVVPPLGLAYLASAAREAGHDVAILDAFAEGLSWEEFERRVSARRYMGSTAGGGGVTQRGGRSTRTGGGGGATVLDVIGFSGMTPVIDAVERAIRVCRPYARAIVLGGPHATACRETVLEENPDLDYAFCGEGETAFVEFLAAFDDNRITSEIPGIVTREGSGPPRERCRDLDSIPFPARDLLPNARYRYPLCGRARVTSMITSRGCPYQCVFCDKSVFGSRWQARSAENVLAEVDEVVAKYGVEAIVFYDDLFTLNRARLAAICEGLIERNRKIAWKAEGRVDIVDREILALMRRAGCDAIAYGVESANPAGLDFIGKNTTPEQAREAFRLTREAGIRTMGYFILGIPTETYDDALRTIRFAIELRADYAQFSALSPLVGSELHRLAKEKGWYAEIAAHNVSDKDRLRPVVLSENWDEEKLKAIVREAHRAFYMRPSYMLRTLLRARSPGDVARMAGLGWNVARYLFRARRG
jgi:radical SAM superfamily enzyme YgiQ (UPF0313 family)